MVQSPSERLQSYWPANRPPVERPLAERSAPKSQAWIQWLAEHISERPVLMLFTAAACGLALGWMVKRK